MKLQRRNGGPERAHEGMLLRSRNVEKEDIALKLLLMGTPLEVAAVLAKTDVKKVRNLRQQKLWRIKSGKIFKTTRYQSYYLQHRRAGGP